MYIIANIYIYIYYVYTHTHLCERTKYETCICVCRQKGILSTFFYYLEPVSRKHIDPYSYSSRYGISNILYLSRFALCRLSTWVALAILLLYGELLPTLGLMLSEETCRHPARISTIMYRPYTFGNFFGEYFGKNLGQATLPLDDIGWILPLVRHLPGLEIPFPVGFHDIWRDSYKPPQRTIQQPLTSAC